MGYDNQGKWVGLGRGRGMDMWHPADDPSGNYRSPRRNSGSGGGCKGTIINMVVFLIVMLIISGLNC